MIHNYVWKKSKSTKKHIAMVNTVSTASSELHIWMGIDLNVALCFQSVLQKNEKIQSGL